VCGQLHDPAALTQVWRTPGTFYIGGWVGPKTSVNAVAGRKTLRPCRELNPCLPARNPFTVLPEWRREWNVGGRNGRDSGLIQNFVGRRSLGWPRRRWIYYMGAKVGTVWGSCLDATSVCYFPVWWPGNKNSLTVTRACRKRRLKWVATLPLGDINTEAWMGVGRGANNPTLWKNIVEKTPRNSAVFCGGGQGLSWAVEPRKEEERVCYCAGETYYRIREHHLNYWSCLVFIKQLWELPTLLFSSYQVLFSQVWVYWGAKPSSNKVANARSLHAVIAWGFSTGL
jgi:hypothetical protein